LSENDIDPIETQEWLEAINSVIEEEGVERASYILSKLANKLNQEGSDTFIQSNNSLQKFNSSQRASRDAG
jgi:pyruvate dehydrogenase E1 component